jgi:hypothetical protein
MIMKKFYLLFSLMSFSIVASFGQVAEISTTANYQQNFDAMGSDGIATLPTGWKVEKMTGATAQRVVGTFAGAVTTTMYKGGANMSATAKNGTYNFGAGDSITATDRALGGSTTGAVTSTQGVNFYLRLKNTGATNIANFTVAYDIEKYRYGNNAAGFSMQLYTSTDGSTWTSAGTDFYTFFAADASTAGAAVVPVQTVSVLKTLPVSLAANGEIYLAWNYSVASGTSAPSAQELALDNVVINGSPTTAIDNIYTKDISFSNGFLQVNNDDVQRISVFSVSGLELATVKNSKTADLSSLRPGTYIVSVTNKKNELKQVKIIR